MDTNGLYKCLADLNRRRILNLLGQGPLCVCHLQQLTGLTQVKMSKQLANMKTQGFIHAERAGTWMIYSLQNPVPPLLSNNLAQLRENKGAEAEQLREDCRQRTRLLTQIERNETPCPSAIYTCSC